MGSTIPVVPIIDIPPTIPNLGLNVFFATVSPCGAKIVIFKTLSFPSIDSKLSPISFLISWFIILSGVGFIAGLPTSTLRPFFVTTPIPVPP